VAKQLYFFKVLIFDPDGRPACIRAELRDGISPARRFTTGQILSVRHATIQVLFQHPAGMVAVEVTGRTRRTPTLLTLKMARFTVWLADAGGRDFGGLPVVARGQNSEVKGRVGAPLIVWEGTHTVRIGARESGLPAQEIVTEIEGSDSILELGRLGALTASWGKGQGWPLRAIRLKDEVPSAQTSPSEQPVGGRQGAQGATQHGRLGQTMHLWPGQYRLEVDGGPTAIATLRAGRLMELDLTALEHRAPGFFQPLEHFARDGIQTLQTMFNQSQRGLVKEGSSRFSTSAGLNGGDRRTLRRLVGPSLVVTCEDARHYPLTGFPFFLRSDHPGVPCVEGRVGISTPVLPGPYQLTLKGILMPPVPLIINSSEQAIVLPALGALQVILRDGLGQSLRGKTYQICGDGGKQSAILSAIVPMAAGCYTVDIPGFSAWTQEVRIQVGALTILDLKALGRIDIAPGPDSPWGTPIWVTKKTAAADEEGPSAAPIEWFVGEPLQLIPAQYRIWKGRMEGPGEPLAVVAGRMRRPTVVGRGFDALAHDDYNRDLKR